MLTVYTRSFNDQLYSMMREFIPRWVACERVTGLDQWIDARKFIEHVIFDCDDFAVICDEDCFIYDFDSVFMIERYMRDHYFTHAGIPDFGAIPHRRFSWTTINPFFNVIDCAGLKSRHVFDPIDKPDFIYSNHYGEPFDDLYLHLYKIGKPLWLNCINEADGITTNVKDHNGKPFALHSWYARDFDSDEHHNRIISVYDRAKRAFDDAGFHCSFSEQV